MKAPSWMYAKIKAMADVKCLDPSRSPTHVVMDPPVPGLNPPRPYPFRACQLPTPALPA